MILILILFSFLFESIISNIIGLNLHFESLFVLITFSLFYPYFNKKNTNYIIVGIILGLFFDIIFTNMPFINTICFCICSILIIINYNMFRYNIISSNIFNLILILIYRFVSYFLLILIGYLKFNLDFLIDGIILSIIINIIYSFLMYIIIDLLGKILNKKNN